MKDKRFLFLLLVFIILEILLINSRGVWAPDEARYARVSYEMKEKNSFLIPYLNGDIYREKPPLFFDISVLFSIFADKVPHYSVKLVSLFSSIIVIFMSIAIAKKLGLADFFLVPLILVGTPKFLWQSQFGQIDMLLCAFVLIQFYLGILIIEEERISFLNIFLLAFSSFGAIVSKGPAGVLPVYISLILSTLIFRKNKVFWQFAGAIFVSLVLTLLWLYFAGVSVGFDYPKSLIFKQTVTRYLEPWHHYAPFYYYFQVVWFDGFPFVFLFIPAIFSSIKNKWIKEKQFLYPLLLILVYFIFFSISSGKRSVYILPVYPLTAIFLSFAIEKWLNSDFPKKSIAIFSSFITLIPIVSIPLFLKKVQYNFSGEVIILVIALFFYFGGAFLFLFYFLKKTEFYPQIMTIFSLVLMFSALPAVKSLDQIKSPYDFVYSAKPLTKCGIQIGVYPVLIPSVNYYLESNTPVFLKGEENKAQEFLAKGNLLIIKEKNTPEIIRKISFPLWEGPIGDDTYLLLASK